MKKEQERLRERMGMEKKSFIWLRRVFLLVAND